MSLTFWPEEVRRKDSFEKFFVVGIESMKIKVMGESVTVFYFLQDPPGRGWEMITRKEWDNSTPEDLLRKYKKKIPMIKEAQRYVRKSTKIQAGRQNSG